MSAKYTTSSGLRLRATEICDASSCQLIGQLILCVRTILSPASIYLSRTGEDRFLMIPIPASETTTNRHCVLPKGANSTRTAARSIQLKNPELSYLQIKRIKPHRFRTVERRRKRDSV